MSSGNGKKRQRPSAAGAAADTPSDTDTYFRTISEEEKVKYKELRALFKTWAGVNKDMSNMLRMTTIINKINHSMRLNKWYAEDGRKKSEIIENPDNYCNFCRDSKGKLLAIEALNKWRDSRGLQPMMGGKRKTRRRNKKQRRKKTKRQRRRKRKTRRSRKKQKGGYTETGNENSILKGKLIKLVDVDGKVVGNGEFDSLVEVFHESGNRKFINLNITPNTIPANLKQFFLSDFDKIIVIGQDSGAAA